MSRLTRRSTRESSRLHTRERQLELALGQARMGTWEWNAETDVTRWSPELEAAFGLASGAFGGTFESFVDLVHPDDRECVRNAFAETTAQDASFEIEFRTVTAEGQVRWLKATAEVLRNQSGRVIQMIGVGQDVTEAKQADERLRGAEKRYRVLVEQLPLASYVEDLNGESATYISPQIADLVGYTAAEWVADNGFFGKVLHPDDRDRVLGGFAEMHATGQQSEYEYRLIARDGSVVWVHDAAVVVRDEVGQSLYAQGYMIDISERKRNEKSLLESQTRLRQQMEKVKHQSLHDDLTDLPNRMLFHDRVEQALKSARRDGSGFAVMLIDLDRFKEVNDTLGHQSGDTLLAEVAGRLRRALRESDTVSRLGGDEFGVLTPDACEARTAVLLAEKLQKELAEPIIVAGLAIEVEASVGIAIFPDHGDDVATLIRHADVSMYVAKESHTPTVYSADYDHNSLERLTRVAELRRALQRDELVVHYQPQTDTRTGEVHTVEALVRWQHPEHGLLGPDEFVPLAERSGLIRALTRYVLDAALGQCNAWRKEGRVLGVAVNITGRDLVDLRFPDEVGKLLAKWSVPPGRLELEITETTIFTDPARARAVLNRLNELGVRLAIDDFGSGNSSLGYLKRLPIDVLKIDRSFVLTMFENDDDAVIVRATIDLGHNLGVDVVAEGVETEEAARRLTALGCDTLQGYHLGRPQPASDLASIGSAKTRTLRTAG
jgi:diguanylate cyclase (GGDEF)-like protein/PAS domain S-box-containing protein